MNRRNMFKSSFFAGILGITGKTLADNKNTEEFDRWKYASSSDNFTALDKKLNKNVKIEVGDLFLYSSPYFPFNQDFFLAIDKRDTHYWNIDVNLLQRQACFIAKKRGKINIELNKVDDKIYKDFYKEYIILRNPQGNVNMCLFYEIIDTSLITISEIKPSCHLMASIAYWSAIVIPFYEKFAKESVSYSYLLEPCKLTKKFFESKEFHLF